jgi:hypothetical protein
MRMDNLRQQMFSPEPSPEPARSSPPKLLQTVRSVSPSQRLMLSMFLFMDVCIICFSCLLLFGKIALPF